MEKLTKEQESAVRVCISRAYLTEDNFDSIGAIDLQDKLLIASDLIKEEFKIGNWYIQDGNMFYASVISDRATTRCQVYGYGFADGEWEDLSDTTNGGWTFVDPETPFRLATKEEVGEALIREAKKLIKKGTIKCLHDSLNIESIYDVLRFDWSGACLRVEMEMGMCCIFVGYEQGKWAKIIEEPKTIKVTIEDIQEKFGSKVEIIESK